MPTMLPTRRLALLLLALALPHPAAASDPVPAEITGCVTQGRFIGGRRPTDRYVIRPRRNGDSKPLDLRPYEGRRLRFSGYLLPGDRYNIEQGPMDLGPC